ncbi:MAG: hypothetical protein BWZ11_01662 [Bacteroidetes bacterium ADurb.BinA395]|nr:MAG: hypothetical protein BWZ11_01662 [Bacteroidetes bacterium ADurb.BinA395]
MFQLSFQHFISSHCIGFGTVGIIQILVAVKFVSRRQSPLLHFVKNNLYIYKSVFHQIDIYFCTQKFFCQKWNVEPIGVVTCQIASFKIGRYFFSYFLKSRTIGHIDIGNAMNSSCIGRNRDPGINTFSLRKFFSVRKNLMIGNFHNTVGNNVDTCCFEVEKNNRFF